MPFKLSNISLHNEPLKQLPDIKLLINTLNAHCYNIAQTDLLYQEALQKSDVLIPDGISIVFAVKWLTGQKLTKIAGADLFYYEMNRLNQVNGKCLFLGSSTSNLNLITQRAKIEFPFVKVETYSPPFKEKLSTTDNERILEVINKLNPDVLFVGMTAPKQEKWAYENYSNIDAGHICSIGAVFDFYGGTVKRAPLWMINCGMEWLYRLLKEPRRMWRRYIFGNIIFIYYVLNEKINLIRNK